MNTQKPLKLARLGGVTIRGPRTKRDLLKHLQPIGDTEKDAAEELSETLKAVKASDKAEQQRFKDTTDSEYWTCLVFQSRQQKEAFLKAMDWLQFGDKYIDGQAVARKQKIPVPASGVRFTEEKSSLGDIPTIE